MEYYRTFRNFGQAMAYYKRVQATWKSIKKVDTHTYVVKYENY